MGVAGSVGLALVSSGGGIHSFRLSLPLGIGSREALVNGDAI